MKETRQQKIAEYDLKIRRAHINLTWTRKSHIALMVQLKEEIMKLHMKHIQYSKTMDIQMRQLSGHLYQLENEKRTLDFCDQNLRFPGPTMQAKPHAEDLQAKQNQKIGAMLKIVAESSDRKYGGACKSCHALKIRCSKVSKSPTSDPCEHCVKKNIKCEKRPLYQRRHSTLDKNKDKKRGLKRNGERLESPKPLKKIKST